VAVLSSVEVLEERLQVDALNLHSVSVFVHDGLELSLIVVDTRLEVLAASKERVVLCNGWHAGVGGLFDSASGEGLVDALREGDVVEELLWVVGLILFGQGVVLILSEVEIQLGEDRSELLLGHVALAQLVEINEELFNTNALHNDHGSETVLDVCWVIADLDAWLHPSVVDDIQFVGGLSEEWRSDSWWDALGVNWLWWWNFWNIAWEDVRGLV